MTVRIIVVLAPLFVAFLALVIWFGWKENRDASRAETLYIDLCASCHGAALEGQSGWRNAVFDSRSAAPPLNGTGNASLHSDDMLLRTIMRKAWPGMGHSGPDLGAKYPDGEFQELLAWIKTHWPKRELSYQKNLTEWAEDRTGPR
ncbi:c-type cytochrome [Alloyangia pacifica]|uniref:c-type cytochrome n=1 Tax=Alloyangia pacifica TaxID=311180 RepID=UPI003D2F2D5E